MTHRAPQRHVRLLAGALALAGFFLCVCPSFAIEPAVSSMSPLGLQRGTEVDVTFGGTRLADVAQLLFYSPGLEVTQLTASADNAFTARVKVAADCRLGIHALRARSASGLSNLRTFNVGALPLVPETEPNTDFQKPQAIPLGCTVAGVILDEDVDYFVVEAKKGQRITAEVVGLRLGITTFDPYVSILNQERFEIARADDSPLLWQDGVVSIIAPADGKYTIQMRESAYGGSGDCHYLLHVGTFSQPTGVYPAGGKPGETLEVTWLGDPAGPRKQQITLPTTSPNAEVLAQDDSGVAPLPNPIRILDLPGALEAEPNDDAAHATVCPAPGVANGIIEKAGDIDHFKFHAAKGQVFDVRVVARETIRSPLDSVLNITRATGGAGVGGNDDTGGPDSYFRFTAPEEDDYIVSVRDHLNTGGVNFVYRVEITPPSPALTMKLPERVQYVSQTLVVPKNNRIAMLVAPERVNFGGDLQFTFGGLPAGITVENETFAGDRGEIPVLFTAGDAAPAGALVDIAGKPADANVKIEGHLNQRTMLVRGQNNRDVWGHNADRMAVALANEVPFKIEVVPPKVPLVQSGSMDLKVKATRAAGFTAPIAVTLLFNPGGVGSSGAISIPENQTEANIPLNADAKAPERKWKIVVIGRAPVAGATAEAASQFVDLEVAAPYVGFNFAKGAVEKGKEADYVVAVEKKKDFAGDAAVELLGLPAGTSAEPTKINKDSTSVAFKVKTTPEAKAGKYPSIVCRVVVTENGEPITHTLGSGEIRVDEPLPPKPNAAPAPAPMPMPAAAPTAPAEKKPLSRLEQLRLEQQGKK